MRARSVMQLDSNAQLLWALSRLRDGLDGDELSGSDSEEELGAYQSAPGGPLPSAPSSPFWVGAAVCSHTRSWAAQAEIRSQPSSSDLNLYGSDTSV